MRLPCPNKDFIDQCTLIVKNIEVFIGTRDDTLHKELLLQLEQAICGNETLDFTKEANNAEEAIIFHKLNHGKIDDEINEDGKWSMTTMQLGMAAKLEQLGDRIGNHNLFCLKAGSSLDPNENELYPFLKQCQENPDLVKGKIFHIAVRSYANMGAGITKYGDPDEFPGHWIYLGASFDSQGKPTFLLNDFFRANVVNMPEWGGEMQSLRENVLQQVDKAFADAPVYIFANEFDIQKDVVNCARFVLNMITAVRKTNIFSQLNQNSEKISGSNKDMEIDVNPSRGIKRDNMLFFDHTVIPAETCRLLRGVQSTTTIREIDENIKRQPIESQKTPNKVTSLDKIYEIHGKNYIQVKREKYAAKIRELVTKISPKNIVDIQHTLKSGGPNLAWTRSSRNTSHTEAKTTDPAISVKDPFSFK